MTRRDASRLIALGGFGWIWSSGGAFPQTQPRPASPAERLERILERIRTKHNLPGLAAAAIVGGKVLASGVAGVRRHGAAEKIRPGDRFHIASCTKSMTAMLAAIAVHKGQLQWTTSLADALPELAAKTLPDFRPATLEKLLAHQAKMPTYTQPSEYQVNAMKALRGPSTEQRLAFLAKVLSTEEPYTGPPEAAYSNVGYAAAGAMIERAAGASWEDLLKREIVRPLGMKNVGFGYPATANTPDQPRGHYEDAGRVIELPLDESRQLAICLWPAGAVNCSIGDLALYAADQLNGLHGRPALLPQAFYQKLHRPLGGGESGFTLGWGITRDQRWGIMHFGSGSGGWFFVRIVIAAERDAAVVSASNSGLAESATREVWKELLEEFLP